MPNNLSNLDAKLLRLLALKGWNISVPWFLCTSLLYYAHQESVLSDPCFDDMAKGMLSRWQGITHRHKAFISIGDLQAGTGYALKFSKLPQVIHGAAYQMLQEYKSLSLT